MYRHFYRHMKMMIATMIAKKISGHEALSMMFGKLAKRRLPDSKNAP